MKHIVLLSGGKDSTAMLLMMIERKMPIDEIIFCDTGMEFPAMYKHLQKIEAYTGRHITRLKAEKTFMYYFAEHEKTKGKRKGERGYGWPRMWVRWCTRLLKQAVTQQYLKSIGEYTQYIGIAADEPRRHQNIPKNTVHPLYDWGITEQQALHYCYEKGFDWDGMYTQFKRVSCWCCPMQSIKDFRILYKKYPKLWKQLKEMDDMCEYKFRPDYSVADLECRFKSEEE